MLQILAALITILNFVYAIIALPGLEGLDLPTEAGILPSVAFFLFFFLEVICSYFICHAVVFLSDVKPTFLRSFSLLFGILNAGTTLFNYKFLFNVSSLANPFDAVVFCAFVFGAFIVDWIVIHDLQMSRTSPRSIFSGPVTISNHYARRERNEFIRIQFGIYLLACLYVLGVSASL